MALLILALKLNKEQKVQVSDTTKLGQRPAAGEQFSAIQENDNGKGAKFSLRLRGKKKTGIVFICPVPGQLVLLNFITLVFRRVCKTVVNFEAAFKRLLMLLLGIDLGTSSVKVSVIDANTHQVVSSVQYPDTESGIISLHPGWAEQSPETWWLHVQEAILKSHSSKQYDPADISAIGIAYQMHGLVLVDKHQETLRDSIIWCDSRAVEIGNEAFDRIGKTKCLRYLLNSPGNFTASKLAWVKENESEIFKKIYKVMLPGDFISMKFTGEITTTISALSEGIFWDFRSNELSKDVLNYFGFDSTMIPTIKNVFDKHGLLKKDVADALSLRPGIPVAYKAGDQPNNALSLNVLKPGEVAATAGTSGVIYMVSDNLSYDEQSRVNSFAHVNHTEKDLRLGVLLCINGTGIMNSWMKRTAGTYLNYSQMNEAAAGIAPGSDGLFILPFGNGAERMLNNQSIGAHIENIDLNKHSSWHLFRAVQEGIAYSFRYGLDIMRENGMAPKIIRAGKSNLFLSEVFLETFVSVTNTPVELYDTTGSQGAAIGAGIGAGIYQNEQEAFEGMNKAAVVEPRADLGYEELYQEWRHVLNQTIKTHLEIKN
ncbi:MAG: Xylulokinase [Chitinophagaceae bacterium]|nr:Xylulokinase [Chitinophagaceae bacterium]